MKFSLFLMTSKGFKVLESLIKKGLANQISEVFYGEDKNIENDFSHEIKTLSKENNIPVKVRSEFVEIKGNYGIAVSWRWIIPNKGNVIVLHDSLLPKYRGFAPLVNALINGETEIGVTALIATEEYDKGDIILQEKIKISYPIKINQAIELIEPLYEKLAIQLLNSSQFNGTSQDESKATYSLWRNQEDYHINWNQSSLEIERFVNALSSPYEGAFSLVNGEKLRITEVEIKPDVAIEIRQPGKVLFFDSDGPTVVCGKGVIKILTAYSQKGENMIHKLAFRTRFK